MSVQRIPFHVEINRIIELLAKQIYQDELALLRENAQNAYDAILQRLHRGDSFSPRINVALAPDSVAVQDNGIGMTKADLESHYWRAGSSGKNNPEARAAGVVGTFGIGGMANFGVASLLEVISESAADGVRVRSVARRDTLSATEECIELHDEEATGNPGTIVRVSIAPGHTVDVGRATKYIRDFVEFLDVPVHVNGALVSGAEFRQSLPPPSGETQTLRMRSGDLDADVELFFARGTGDAWVRLHGLTLSGLSVRGEVVLRQGQHQIRTFRSRFGLAPTALSSTYSFGGLANLPYLQPTAGREALTTESMQVLQRLLAEIDRVVSEAVSTTDLADLNTPFLEWASRHGRLELLDNVSVRFEPEGRNMRLKDVRELSQKAPVNYYDGSDQSLIDAWASVDKPLLVLARSNPRRQATLAYLTSRCKVNRIEDSPQVLHRKSEKELSAPELSFAFRVSNILESDYFVHARVAFGSLSHGLPLFVDTKARPIEVVIDSKAPALQALLQFYQGDYEAATGMAKDFVRSSIFPKISSFVPSSQRQGHEAFIRAIKKPREVFEYGSSDMGDLNDIWLKFAEGTMSLEEATRRSTNIVRTAVQVVDRATNIQDVLPEVANAQRLVAQAGPVPIAALPAITRLDQECNAKLLVVDDADPPINGYRCFIALSDRVRTEQGDFFLQPHTTEIVWGGQKAFYIFTHHSGDYGLYYELAAAEPLSDSPGGKPFPTSTIVVKNQVYVGVPEELRLKFIPAAGDKKRFFVRCDMLYLGTADAPLIV